MSDPANSALWVDLLRRLREEEPQDWLVILREDQHARWERGQRFPAEAYLDHLANLPLDDETAVDLIYSEVLLRAERNEEPSVEEYVARFPRFADLLRQQFELMRAMQAASVLEGLDGLTNLDTLRIGSGTDSIKALDCTDEKAESGSMYPPPGYLFIRPLGQGGMGVVHLAQQLGLNRLVALKMIRPDSLPDEASRERFRREAKTAARLNHPNIVQVYEVGEHEGRPFFSQEYCEGGSLATHSPGVLLAPRAAAEMIETLARAVQHAHVNGVIHRDLKPANILLVSGEGGTDSKKPQGPFSTPKIADFGLAKLLSADEAISRSHGIVGTPAYMPPEEASGRAITPVVDVYGLGTILYELLAGKPPFQGDNVLDVLEAVRFNDPTAPSRLNDKVHRDLDTICLKCLRKEPEKRYASARELAEDVRRFLDGEPIRARPIRTAERMWRWCIKHPALPVATLLAIALLVVLWFIDQKQQAHTREIEKKAELAEVAESEQRQQKEAAEDAERGQRYLALLRECREDHQESFAGWTRRSLDKLRQAAVLQTEARDEVQLRTEAARLLGGSDLHEEGALLERFRAGGIAIHPDGKRVAIAQAKALAWVVSAIHVIDLDKRAIVQTFNVKPDAGWSIKKGVQDGLRSLAFSRDGRWLLTGTRSGWVMRWDLERTDDKAIELKTPDTAIEGLYLPADGKSFLTLSRETRTVRRWTLEEKPRETGHFKSAGSLRDVALSPSGEELACCSAEGITLLKASDLGEIQKIAQIDPSKVLYGPDGRSLLVEANEQLLVFDLLARRATRHLRDPESIRCHEDSITCMSLSADGTLLATSCDDKQDRKVKLWDVVGGRLAATLVVQGRGPLNLAFTTDGSSLVVGCDETVKRFAISGFDVRRSSAYHTYPVQAMTLTGNGQRLWCVSSYPAETTGLQRDEVTTWNGAGKRLASSHLERGYNSSGQPVLSATANGERLAWGGINSEVRFRLDGKGSEQSLQIKNVHALALSPDGSRVWVTSEARVQSWRLPDLVPASSWTKLSTEGLPQIYTLSVGNKWVIGGGRDGCSHLFQASEGTLKQSWGKVGTSVSAVVLSPDESLAAVGTREAGIRLMRVPGGETVADLPGHRDAVEALAFDGTGTLLASGSRDRTIRLWRREGGEYRPLLTLRALPASVRSLWLDREGHQLVALLHGEAGVRAWDLKHLRRRCEDLGIQW